MWSLNRILLMNMHSAALSLIGSKWFDMDLNENPADKFISESVSNVNLKLNPTDEIHPGALPLIDCMWFDVN